MGDFVKVTQDDRKWAADLVITIIPRVPEFYRSAILAGKWDATKDVQLIARHRIASIEKFKEENNK